MVNTAEYIKIKADEGADGIYKKYAGLIKASDSGYESEINALSNPYRKARSTAVRQSEIAKINSGSALADTGLSVSGESLQNDILIGNALAENLAELDSGYLAERSKLQSEKKKTAASLSAEAESEALGHRENMLKMYVSQLNADRDYSLDTEREKAKRADADREFNLALDKIRLEQKNAEADRMIDAMKLAQERVESERDYKIKKETLRLTEAQNSFENAVAAEYLKLEVNKV